MDTPDPHQPVQSPSPQPAFLISWRESWALALITVAIGLTYLWQLSVPPEAVFDGALSGQALAEGRWWTLLTSMFLHGGLSHLLMNLSALLPFGLIVGRRMGGDLRGQLALLALYFGAGLSGDLVYLLLAGRDAGPVVGASGAIFGLWGAVVRLPRDRGVWPLVSPQVARALPGPIIANLIVTLAFGAVSGLGGEGAGGIAWQAHLGGFLFGLLAVGVLMPRRQVSGA